MLSKELLDWQASGQYFDFQGYQVFAKFEGVGPAILLIHGFPSASWDWQAIWPALNDSFQLITADMLGFGLSDKPGDFDYSISAQADLYEALMIQQGIQSAHILAHDYGDTVAQELLARHNAGQLGFEVKTVTLLNGGLFPETHRPLLVQRLLMSPLGGLVVKLMNQKSFTHSLTSICSDDLSLEDVDLLWQLLNFNDGKTVLPQLICYMRERKQHRARWVGALQQTQVPLHLINGLIDPISGAHLVTRFKHLVPRGQVTELAGVGHYPQVESPEAVVKALLMHLIEKN